MRRTIEASGSASTLRADIAVVGAGAAGLMAAIAAGREASRRRARIAVVVLDGARTLGAKILIAGGGRCNVTHDVVDESAFAGAKPAAIRKILRRFDVGDTVRFFAERGVALKREESGKLFPVTDRSRTVLDALIGACLEAGAVSLHPWRVEAIEPAQGGFAVRGPAGTIAARRVILATGGKALPKSGSDGHGLELARRLGHTTTKRILPALVPLVVDEGCFIRRLTGITVRATLSLRTATGKPLITFTGSTLCTHFGLSGPPVLDISRHWLHARLEDPGTHLVVNWLPDLDPRSCVAALEAHGGSASAWLKGRLPDRLAEAVVGEVGIDPGVPVARLPRTVRTALGDAACAYRIPVRGDRGFTHAEVTAGGVPLSETKLETLGSRVCPGLYLAGEILDVDGRIGGFNFQWAWASGFVAGTGAAAEVSAQPPSRSGGTMPLASR